MGENPQTQTTLIQHFCGHFSKRKWDFLWRRSILEWASGVFPGVPSSGLGWVRVGLGLRLGLGLGLELGLG